MKAELRKDGQLVISSENELESYALSKWVQDNLQIISNPEVNKKFVVCYGLSEK